MPLRLLYRSQCSLYYRLLPTGTIASFHTSRPQHTDNPDFYETLQVPHNASAAAIKESASLLSLPLSSSLLLLLFLLLNAYHLPKPTLTPHRQFYTLSKLHHPDHHPSDPHASTRFIAISEAYATLGTPSKRDRYDRDVLRPVISSSPSAPTYRHGSHHSSSTFFGSRPASGLSKRRTRFHGPPPSFYKSGGWGAHGAKRAAGQEGGTAGSSSETAAGGQENAGYAFRGGGTSPGQASHWSDVPHFDREGHRWTQEQQEMRRKRRMEAASEGVERVAPGMLFNFLLVSGVVGLASLVSTMWRTGVKEDR